jgi:GT2 family glycosyltransferase
LANVVIVTGDPESFTYHRERWGVTVMERPSPFVYAAAINVALREYGVDDYFLLNDDTTLESFGGLSLMSELGKFRELGCVSAGMKGYGGALFQQVETGRGLRIMKEGHVSFTATLVTHTAIERVGLLDEQFNAYGYEDTDYVQRCRVAGLGIAVFDGCVIRHKKSSTTFDKGDGGVFTDNMLRGELLYHRKWTPAAEKQVVVLAASRSGGSVVARCLSQMGIVFGDPAPDWQTSSSSYYRDELIANLLERGEMGAELYARRRDSEAVEKGVSAWGLRAWPNVEGIKTLLASLSNPLVVVMYRSTDAMIPSYIAYTGESWQFAEGRIEKEVNDLGECMQWIAERGIPMLPLPFADLIHYTRPVLDDLALFVGWDKSVTAAEDWVVQRLYHYDPDGNLYRWPEPEGFGKIAVGVRIARSPDPQFVGSLAALMHSGLREGDEFIKPVAGVPSHYAATYLMRRFLATDCDTLLLLDDDMVFNPDTLEKMRDKQENWEYDIISAFTTQRVQPPRGIVLRLGEQPPFPDSENGVYYDMLVDEVQSGATMGVDAVGFAFTLVRRSVLEAIVAAEGLPVSHTHFVEWGSGGIGEDVNFCRRAGSLGARIAVDVDAHVGHVGSVHYGWTEFQYWRNQAKRNGVIGGREAKEILSENLTELDADRGDKAIRILARI